MPHLPVTVEPVIDGNVLSHVEAGESYPTVCWTAGDSISENGATNDVWIKLPLNAGGFGYVSAVYLKGNEHAGLPADASW
ncbi:MAG: hypothetical protein WBV74_02910 [Pseudonocardiaceae bacterium]